MAAKRKNRAQANRKKSVRYRAKKKLRVKRKKAKSPHGRLLAKHS